MLMLYFAAVFSPFLFLQKRRWPLILPIRNEEEEEEGTVSKLLVRLSSLTFQSCCKCLFKLCRSEKQICDVLSVNKVEFSSSLQCFSVFGAASTGQRVHSFRGLSITTSFLSMFVFKRWKTWERETRHVQFVRYKDKLTWQLLLLIY